MIARCQPGSAARVSTVLRVLLTATLVVGFSFSAASAADENSLANLVPDDVGLSVEVNDLAAHVSAFRETELYRRLACFRPVQKFLDENGAALANLAAELREQTGLTPDELMQKLLGGRVLVAVWPGSTDADAPPGPALLIARCTDAEVLKTTVDHLLAAQRAAGRHVERQSWKRDTAACTIHRIETGPDQPALFIAHLDRMGIVSTDARMVKSVLEFQVGSATGRSLLERAEYLEGMARLNPASTIRLFVNPRAWEPLLSAHIPLAGSPLEGSAAAAPADEAASAAGQARPQKDHWLLRRMRAADYLVASCQLGRQIVVEGFLEERTESGGDKAAPVAAAEHDDLAERLPAGALVAVGGRINLSMLLARFFHERGISTKTAQHGAASDDCDGPIGLARLIGGEGYDAVAALVARSGDTSPQPGTIDRSQPSVQSGTDWIVGFDTNALLPSDRLALARRLDPILRGALTAAVMIYNGQGQSMAVDSAEEQGVPLTSVEGLSLLGQGDAATFSLGQGFFWAGTSRVIVRNTAQLKSDRSLAGNPRFRELASPRIAERTHLAYLDFAALRRLLVPAPANTVSAGSDAKEQPHDLAELLGLADRLLVEMQVDRHVLAVSATITADDTPAGDSAAGGDPADGRPAGRDR